MTESTLVSGSLTSFKHVKDDLQALAGALEFSNVLIRRWDGTIEHWTAGCERLYGWTAQEAVGQISYQLLKTEFPAPLDQINRELMESKTWQGEFKQIRKDGREVFVSVQLALLSRESGVSPLVISTHTDITGRLYMQRELEMANDRLKRMANELERSNEELEDFARIASHDLSAPITSTRWLVDILTSRHAKQLDNEGRNCLKQISMSLERMSDLVEAVLAHAMVGKNPIGTLEESDTEQALASALANLSMVIETSGASVSHDPLPPLLIGAQPLTQLFQNLLSNAIKYKRPDVSPTVTITAQPRGALWLIAVQDNGIGIEPEWFERIFQPLQRRHGMQVAGSGIGLATCKKIVTRAGGKIWVESEVGAGSTFYFTLPGGKLP